MSATYRPATPADLDPIRWCLYTALAWNPERQLPPIEITLEHPEARRYHENWGRPGDLGVIATDAAELTGVAYCRLFTKDDHGHGYIDENTPELAVAVRADRRGHGLGAELMNRLAQTAHDERFEQLSLSVDTNNPARRLYERLGYTHHSRDEDGIRMILDLPAAAHKQRRHRT